MNKRIGIILPAYNEERVIGGVLDSLPIKFTVDGEDYGVSIIVVNDGSRDKTSQIVGDHNHVILINHLLNSGAGAATRTGLHYARGVGYDFAATLDADGQHASDDLEKIIQSLVRNEADFIIGSRLLESKGMPGHRVLGNRGLSLITYLLFGVFVTDSQSGLRGFNKTALEQIDFRSDHYAFCSEMIWHAKQLKLRIKEVPIQAIYTDYSMAKGQSNWGALSIIGQLVKRRLVGLAHE